MNRPPEVGRLRSRQSGGVSQPVFHRTESLQPELDAPVVVVADVVVHASFECRDAIMRLKMVVLGLEGAEEALDHRVVKAVPSATHALFDSVMLKHRSVWPHFVVPALIRMHNQSRRTF